ncbi:MAG: PTS glucitol/sorbitol transporter subunit IIA [Streptococcaceae bacterium]|jgi:PTS system glucitol/sorbitol-specific IIA component|nr:PTS glucitol/sorbitol transporter subunit IIA [Streptococcaceae bacterium]
MQSTILSIGTNAISKNENILIFFNESATELIKEHSIIQRFATNEFQTLEKGDFISFGEQQYTIEHVGKNVLEQLQELGHVTFFFGNGPKEELINAITLVEERLPEILVGMKVTYKVGV